MKLFITLAIFLLFANFGISQTSIYSFQVISDSGQTVDFSAFQGKRILIINTGSNSFDSAQLSLLQVLRRDYDDTSLIIIAFPRSDLKTTIFSPLQNCNPEFKKLCAL